MKGIKLSKTSWLILSAGIFVVILGGLGVTRSQQLKEQSKLEEDLGLSTTRVDNIHVEHLRPQLEELQLKLDETKSQLDEAVDILHQSVVSVDVTEKYFAIAESCGVVIQNISNTTISTGTIEGISCNTISIHASVTGELEDIVDFLISLNENYATGYVQSTQISNTSGSPNGESTASFNMIVYSYEGT
jgi:hypothetical protein